MVVCFFVAMLCWYSHIFWLDRKDAENERLKCVSKPTPALKCSEIAM